MSSSDARDFDSLFVLDDIKVWTWGVNDNGALGRRTAKVLSPPDQADTRTDPENEPDTRTYLNNDELETTPMLVEELAKEGYRAVKVAAGDNVSLAIDDKGEVRYWGSFRVSPSLRKNPASIVASKHSGGSTHPIKRYLDRAPKGFSASAAWEKRCHSSQSLFPKPVSEHTLNSST